MNSKRRKLANAIRALSMDAVQKANSGHPGMPMGMADIAEVLWNDYLKHNPQNPKWPNRDRFILSNGHGSLLQYSLLHLTGYDLTIEDLKNFRQLHSKTPGHPEVGETPGIETTTGPLGQGLANAIGMAIAKRLLAKRFNRDQFNLIDHYIYVFVGDGCLMEGISHEVCSLAGTLCLDKLIVFWDNNGISIDGKVDSWFTDNTPERFRAYNWHVVADVDGHDADAVKRAIEEAHSIKNKPCLICCKTIIGFGAPTKAGEASCHGAPLGAEEVMGAKKNLGWTYPPFEIPKEIYEAYDARKKGAQVESDWNKLFQEYQRCYPELAKEFKRRIQNKLPDTWEQTHWDLVKKFYDHPENIATRKAFHQVLEAMGPILTELIGGSADLSESNNTMWSGCHSVLCENENGNYIHYGVREFGMSAMMNGMALYGCFIPYGGTFLVFESYAASAVRMSALMKQRVIYIYSHDSIGLGEDGPTHQPVEQLPTLRAIPHMSVWRPCDAVETAFAVRAAIERTEGPTSILTSRQTLSYQKRSESMLKNILRGGYILVEPEGDPDIILIATGSEVDLAVKAAQVLAQIEKKARVVSMPSTDVFLNQDMNYQEKVLPRSIKKRVAIEAAAGDYWYRFVGTEGRVFSLERFGLSAPLKDILPALGFCVERVVAVAEEVLKLKK